MNKYILYGIKNNIKYYITNTNPILWSPNVECAKSYNEINTAKFSILRDWDNYEFILKQINAGLLDMLFVAVVDNNIEKERVKLL